GDRPPRGEHAAPVVNAPAAIAPPVRPDRIPTITARADLEALAADIRAAGVVGLAALYDGPSAVRSDLVGLAFAVGERRAYLPLVHRYLGAPSCLPEA